MNAENFMEYLAQPAKLYQLPYQEIKNLVEEYPYSTNLRQLLLLKSKIEHDPKFEQHLHSLAAHTFDREHLFSFVHEKIPQLLDLDTEPEEKLELKDLTQLATEKEVLLVEVEKSQAEDRKPEAIRAPDFSSGIASEIEPGASGIKDGYSSDEEETEEDRLITMEWTPANVHTDQEEESTSDFSPETAPEKPETEDQTPETLRNPDFSPEVEENEIKSTPDFSPEGEENKLEAGSLRAKAQATDDFKISPSLFHTLVAGSLLNTPQLQPRAKEQFNSWRQQIGHKNRFQRLRQRGESNATRAAAPTKARQRAKQSVQDQTNLASETLAKLLTRQQQYSKAIKIYERLSLLYPEKSRYFAATIEELKQKQ